MSDMKPILCVVDLAESCEKVLEAAVAAAKTGNLHVIILFVYRLIVRYKTDDVSTLKSEMETYAAERFRALETIISSQDISYEFQVEIGFAADRITSYIKRGLAGSVIMSTEQVSMLDDFKVLTLREFLTETKTPFLVVPTGVATVEDRTVTKRAFI